MERTLLAPGYEISRVIRGGWQLAGGHGAVDRHAAVDDLMATAEAGITTFDCADIYTGVEELIGAFRAAYGARHGADALAGIRVHTKFVPDLEVLPTISKAYVEKVIDTSLTRLRIERLDLVQFHWWDYAQPGFLETAGWLDELRRAGKIERISGTNFDAAHIEAIASAGIPVTSVQVQYSLLDDRPARRMSEAAARLGFKLLCYGTVAGGFLSDRWLGQSEPADPLENRSLTKYKLIIDDAGGWAWFQSLLAALRKVADRHDSDIATVASRAVLGFDHVAGVIVGARNRAHLDANLAVGALRLDEADREILAPVLALRRSLDGEVYELERDRAGRHGAIMKYNLNAEPA
ncbi:aldo/keto reductase [Mesorhizobium sp. CAU 1741]|uniref:aldo/keto reductase n=1 Tax=Mesorhizobium sp. CAU 1741 TaxID=3140366 RepID=UPI00325BDE30